MRVDSSHYTRMFISMLRSGAYKQVRGQLCGDDNKRCAAGVLCELGVKEGVTSKHKSDFGQYYYGSYNFAYPPKAVTSLIKDYYFIKYKDRNCTIAELNDGHCLSFNEIANLIEEKLNGNYNKN